MNKWHPKLSKRNLSNDRLFAEIGYPNLLKVWHKAMPRAAGKLRGATKWKTLAAKWPAMEASLTAWEDAHPVEYRAMPWYEEREAFRAAKARGEVVWPLWWEIAAAAAELGRLDRVNKILK